MNGSLSEAVYRLSSYTIFVQLDDPHSGFLLVHGYTGAIDYVTKAVGSLLKSGRFLSKDTFEGVAYGQGPSIFERLIKRGYLTQKSPLQEKEWVARFATRLHESARQKSNFLFLVAYDCNFRCPYCFENDISSHGKGWSKKVITESLVDAAYRSMEVIQPDAAYRRKEIILYGGEPLLATQKGIVEYIVAQGQKRGYHFKAITNGYDLDEFMHLLGPGGIEKLQITIDGTREKHDARRTHYQHGSSFDKIINNVQTALDLNTKVTIRINTELNNFDEIGELHQCFKELGFSSYPNFRVYSALIHGEEEMNCNAVMAPDEANSSAGLEKEAQIRPANTPYEYDPDAQYIDFENEEAYFLNTLENQGQNDLPGYEEEDRIRTMNRGKFIRKYEELTEAIPDLKANISCQDFGIRQKLSQAIAGNTKMAFTSVFCTAQSGMMIFDPDGDLYTCWETVGQEYYKVGTYADQLVIDEEKLALWYGRNISKIGACSKCKYALFCGGGCQVLALKDGRGFNSPYCDGLPKTFHRVAADLGKELLTNALATT